MHSIFSLRRLCILMIILPAIALIAGCDGKGPERIAGTPAPPDTCSDAIDFEDACGPFVFSDFGGGAASVINNPDPGGINTTAKVGRMQKFAAEVYGGSTLDLGGAVDFAAGTAFTMKVWSSRAVPVLFKLEGLDQERSVNHSGSGGWEELCFNFTGSTAGPAATAITLIFDLGVMGDATNDPGNWTFYFDGITQVAGCGAAGPVYELVFADEFDTAGAPSNANWTIETGYGPDGNGWGNNEWQLYTTAPENVRVEGGNLVLEAQCPVAPCGVRDGSITSGKINSLGKFNFKFGKIEARIKPPVGKAAWPAFWSLGTNFPTVGWPRSGEIDFMEMHNFYSDANTTHTTMHWCDDSVQAPANCWTYFTDYTTLPNSLGDDFHIWEAVWDENQIVGKIDGQVYFTKAIDPATMDEFLNEFFLIMNVAMGGTLGSGDQPPDGTEIYPQTMLVDYVRVYQEAGTGGTGGVPDVVLYATDPSVPVDLVYGVDYTGYEPFGSGSVFDGLYAGDADYSPAFAVTTGADYGANIGQFAYVGFQPGFASAYGTLEFKAKGLSNDIIRVKFLDGGAYLDVNLATSGLSTSLGNGWYQVSIPLSSMSGVNTATGLLFETDNASPAQFTFLMTDIGFSGTAGGGGGTGIVPDVVLYATDPSVPVDLVFGVDYTALEPFGSGSVFDGTYAGDADYSPAFSVTTGPDYGANIGQLAFVGFQPGFAASYGTLDFKVKGMWNDVIRVKFLDNGAYLDVNLTAGGVSTSLGNGWYQVSLPLSSLTGVDTATALLFETGGASPAPFTFLLTDIGFSGTAGGGGVGTGIIPDAVLYATDPAVNVDFVFGTDYTAIEPFGSGSVFDNNNTSDADFSPAFSVTTGAGYGAQVGQLAFIGFAPGFASAYGTLDFKIKGINNNLVRVKFLDGGTYLDVTLTSSAFSTLLGNGWYQVSIPLASLSGVDTAIGLLFETDNTAANAFTFLMTDIGFSGTAGGGGPSGELAINGDFEAGDLSGWVVIPNGGSITADNTQNNGGLWSGHLVAGAGQNPVLKQERLAAGTVVPGDTINISFDMRGSAVAGGVIFPELISEGAGGAAVGNLLDTIAVPTAGWTTYTYSPVAGADVSGGITFQIAVVCGADNACSNDVYIDNVSITINGGGGGGVANPGAAVTPQVVLYATDPAVPVDLVFGVDYTALEPFGSGSVFDAFYANDTTYNPVMAVSSGAGYGANIAQLAFIGFAPGFAAGYDVLNFKIKGIPGDLIRLKFLDAGGYLDINLTTDADVTLLGDGWYQASVPLTRFTGVDSATGLLFESNNTSATAFTYFLTDIGFSNAAINNGPAPDVVLYATDPAVNVDLVFGVDYTAIEPFGSGSVFDNNNTSDADFSPAFSVTTGSGYGVQVGQLAFLGFAPGFATGYGTLEFKIKGINNDLVRVKFLDGGAYLDVTLTSSAFSTSLGNGWYQVSIPITSFTGVDTATGLLFETDNTAANAFTFLMTDIGFNTTNGGGGVGTGIIPSVVLYATDPAVNVDLVFGTDYTAIEPFGSGSVFDNNNTSDGDFSPAFSVTTGNGYGVQVGQLAFIGFAPGFATAYGALNFKIKGINNDLVRVKFLDGGAYLDVTLTSSAFSNLLGNGWYQVSIPLASFTGVDTATGLLFETDNTAPDAFTFLMTDMGFSGSAGELAVNGDFEAGDLSGWVVYPNGGSITADNTQNNGGSWSGHAVAGAGQNPVLKQERIAVGTVVGGDIIDISFDMKGSAADGGIVFPELISEGAGGATVSQILETIVTPTAGWTTYSYSPAAAADVSGGITFQIAVVCGGAPACSNNVYIDNVSITIR